MGNDKDAEEYLRKLGTESEVAGYVHVILGATVTGILDELDEASRALDEVSRAHNFLDPLYPVYTLPSLDTLGAHDINDCMAMTVTWHTHTS